MTLFHWIKKDIELYIELSFKLNPFYAHIIHVMTL